MKLSAAIKGAVVSCSFHSTRVLVNFSVSTRTVIRQLFLLGGFAKHAPRLFIIMSGRRKSDYYACPKGTLHQDVFIYIKFYISMSRLDDTYQDLYVYISMYD